MKHLLITIIAAVLLVGCGNPDSALLDAANEGNIAAGADVNAKDDEYGWTPLIWAADGGHKNVAALLIAKGANVNAKSEGWTALHSAAEEGYKEIAELLIANGADVNAKGK
jgi:ankyrin repeat protein